MGLASVHAWYEPKPPICLKLRSSTRFIGVTAFVASFTEGFLYGAIVPVLPFSLVERSGVSEENVQFWLSVFLMTFGIAMTVGAPTAGWAVSRAASRKTPFLVGLIIAFMATLLFCLGRAPWVLTIARAFQGLAVPLLYTSGLALVADSVDRDQIGSWLGFVFSGMNCGLLIAPFLAGAIYERVGYYPVFAVILGVLALEFVLLILVIEKKTAAAWLERPSSDESASSEESASVKPHESGQAKGSVGSTNNVTTVASDEGDRERPDPDECSPLLPRQPNKSWFATNFPMTTVLLSSPRLNAAVYGGFIHTLIIVSFDTILPLFVNRTFGWKSTAGGLIFLTLTVPSLLSSFIGILSDRCGARLVALCGFAILIPSLAFLGLCNDDSMRSKVLLGALLALIGFGLNMILTPLATDVYHQAEILAANNPQVFHVMGAFAQVYSLFNAALGLGSVVGPGLSGILYAKTSWELTGGILALLCALGSIPVWLYTGAAKKANKVRGYK